MSLIVDQASTGLEEIQREALIVLFESLNDALAEVEAHWHESDAAIAARFGVPYVPTTLERVEPTAFYEGHRPSLIKAPVTGYPNVAVSCLRAVPAPGNTLDQMEVYNDTLYVETMVKSMDEGECNRRAHRMASAVNLVLMGNKNLNGMVSGIDAAPTVALSELFTRKEQSAYGPEWFWQGARNEYVVRKEAVIPSSAGGFFRSPAQQYDIDQQ